MNAFDKFIIGDTNSIEWCFENRHFNKRLDDNGISREFIVDTIYNKEPLHYEHSGKNEYAVTFPAPSTKNYPEIKLIFACHENKIDLVTIMPHGNTNRQKNVYKSDQYKKKEKMINKAKSKRQYL
ncbi:hypothetical protein BGI41_00575 [Methanobrevibacter sp. 87.7]|uniref:DUF4258 domain-containing protein n=1 Tax=Methanobrevibacter sp. 87.7 TaxID=387957 RepID=UPI000B5149BD|nr:DUF4258 domain-containing protein [Methanobrevibacter sp. 87.7]OWT33803.1 hypothetical protein BGI41_00575 [Methanobrevibacter sp. 87.7]